MTTSSDATSIDGLPPHHHTLNTFVLVDGARDFIEFLTDVFGATETAGVRTPDRDGTIIHAEVVLGDSTIMLADRKPDWPFTPAFNQVYVDDLDGLLERGRQRGARVVTPRSSFYGGYDLARMLDPWRNLWWLYTPAVAQPEIENRTATTDWHDKEPSAVYSTLMATMRELRHTVDQDSILTPR